jgi:membrane associated rhomboid family serine protease
VPVPAIVAIGMWAVLQFISGFGSLTVEGEPTGGVAYMAHIGGFVAGVVAGFLFRAIYPRRPPARGLPVSSWG